MEGQSCCLKLILGLAVMDIVLVVVVTEVPTLRYWFHRFPPHKSLLILGCLEEQTAPFYFIFIFFKLRSGGPQSPSVCICKSLSNIPPTSFCSYPLHFVVVAVKNCKFRIAGGIISRGFSLKSLHFWNRYSTMLLHVSGIPQGWA